MSWKSLCNIHLKRDSSEAFKRAISDDYYFEMMLDELPIWGYVGELEREAKSKEHGKKDAEHDARYYLFAHLDFSIAWNGPHIIEVNVTSGMSLTRILSHAFSHTHSLTSRFPLIPHPLCHTHYATPLMPHTLCHTHYATPTMTTSQFRLCISPDSSLSSISDPLKRVDVSGKTHELELSYSVRWTETNVTLAGRMMRYAQYSFLPQSFEIHWLSIINSFVLVLLLTAFLAIILMRVLKNDLSKYARSAQDLEDDEEETGWKLVHGDVFRLPPNVSIFCAYVGTGVQLLSLSFFMLVLAVMNMFYPGNRGAMYTAAIVLYALTAGTAGFISAHLYCRLRGSEESRWAWNLLLSATLFPLPLFCMFCFLNTVAIAYNSQAALPFGTILVIAVIWALVTLPLNVIGGIMGRNMAKGKDFGAPCGTNQLPREIPAAPWYRQGPCQVFMAGFLPFSAIYIELHYIFASVWGHKLYTLYGILFIAFLMLLIVTSFITIALSYFQLAIEDHRWWWRSFLSGGSTGLFVYAYSFFYYFGRSGMFGFMQTSFFFGYMLVASYAAAIMLGTVGFLSSLVFVRRIYQAIKCD